MEEDGPDFGYAFGSQPATPFWNPAFRPDTPAVVQSQSRHSSEESPDVHIQEENAVAQNGTVTNIQEKQTLSDTGFQSDQPQPPHDGLQPQDSSPQDSESQTGTEGMPSQLVEAIVTPLSTEEVGRTSSLTIPPHAETTQLDGSQALQDTPSYTPLYPDSSSANMSRSVETPFETHAPNESYEPQGQSTFLDEATQEPPSMPLMTSDGDAFDWGQGTDDFGLSAPAEPGQGLSYTDTVPVVAQIQGAANDAEGTAAGGQATALDWGSDTHEEPLFGGSLRGAAILQAQTSALERPGDGTGDPGRGQAQESKAASEPQEADMSAWEAAFGDDELLDEDQSKPSEGPAFFEDDGEGFLDDMSTDHTTGASASASTATGSTTTASKYSPVTSKESHQAQNSPYGVQGAQFTDFTQLSRSSSTPQTSLGSYEQVPAYGAARPQIKPAGDGTSFSDKAKTGYASPYDLPEDLSKAPRRRPGGTGVARQNQQTPPAPPPRSSSYGFPPQGELTRTHTATSLSNTSQARPPSSGSVYQPSHEPQSRKPSLDRLATAPSAGTSGFFADLPATQRAKREPSGRYSPAQTPQLQQRPNSTPGPPQHMQPQVPPPNAYAQFQQPDRPAMFPEQPTVPAAGGPKSSAPPSSRYSPAPGSGPSAGMTIPSTITQRYSPAPPPQSASAPYAERYASAQSGPPKPPIKPFAPRTSSPLAQFTSAHQQDDHAALISKPLPQEPGMDHDEPQNPESGQYGQRRQPYQNGYATTPPNGAIPTSTPPPPTAAPHTASPRKRSTYTPSSQLPLVPETTVVPPIRSQSGSPGSRMRQSKLAITPIDRPASAYDLPSPKQANVPLASSYSLSHRRGYSQELNFIPPQDERVHDPLQRWKGCPIFSWGPAGHVVSVFPMHVPRYGGGQAAPMIKASPGEPKIQSVKDVTEGDDIALGFPGPLKKGKKKEVVTWLKSMINAISKQTEMVSYRQTMPHDAKKTEEKLLLWKTVLVLVEHDGVLEGTPAVQEAVRAMFDSEDHCPPHIGLDASDSSNALGLSPLGVAPEAIKPEVVGSIRAHLASGEREKAAWMAVDERLWGHAMLISSTLSKDVWKQVIQEFVRKEVKSAGAGNESLAVLYEVFAGNWEESIDQLVPASARAGFQMISTVDSTTGHKDALAGLDKWKETLKMILNNRSTDDTQALLALGKLLAQYGRTEAAHTCYLFARHSIYFGGADDSQAHLTLLGADPRFHANFGQDLESILLSEVYEFALSMSSSAPTPLPHLQSYKLSHALILAEAGLRDKSKQYCEDIATSVSSKTKLSPYYNAYFIGTLDDLAMRLKQTPGASGAFSKVPIKQVSSSLFNRFNSFVAGDDRDDAGNSTEHQENGPFARVAGDTPPMISRTTSLQDMYGSYSNGGPVGGIQPAGRYAPGGASNAYAPRASLEQARPQHSNQYAPQSTRTSLESVRAGEAAYSPSISDHNTYANFQMQQSPQPGHPSSYSPPQQRSYAPQMPRAASYQGLPGANGQHGSSLAPYTPPTHVLSPSPYSMTPESEGTAPMPYQQSQPRPQAQHADSYSYEPQASGDVSLPAEPQPSQTSSHDLPGQGSTDLASPKYDPVTPAYEAPSYQPHHPEADFATDEADDAAPKPKEKSFMDDDDDDDDLIKRAAALKSQGKAKADSDADEAFRRAAEADANRPPAAERSSGWFGGWFKKDPNAPQQGPIKAKLGEESSFVYDPELKRWVDKKNPQAASAATATPPPPKGPIGGMRSTSGTPPLNAVPNAPPAGGMRAASGPPLGTTARTPSGTTAPAVQAAGTGPPSRVGTPASMAGEAPSTGAQPGPGGGGGPPSRPPTSMSNASSIDDLIGPAAGRKGATKKKGRGGRYVDVMANQGS